MNNRGMTLIELIISVCIMMLIILPTYGAFNAALRSTGTAREVTYAQTATQTVLEEIKYLGKAGVTAAGRPGASTQWAFHQGNPSSGTPAYYTMVNTAGSGYVEGTEAFEVRVYFDTESYASNANAYSYSDLSDFAGECSEIINPDISTVNYDSLAEEYFIRQYIDYAHQRWQKDWEAYEAAYLTYYEELRAWQQRKAADASTAGAKPDEPAEPGAFTDPRDLPGYNEAAFMSCINKDQELRVVPSPDGKGYILSSVITYDFNTSNSYGYQVTSETRTFSGFCEKAINATTESLYVLYKAKDPYLLSNRDRVTIINGMYDPTKPRDINIFIVVQAPAGVDYGDTSTTGFLDVYIPQTYTNEAGVEVANHAETLYVHSQATMAFPNTIDMPGQTPIWNSNSEDADARLLRIITGDSQERISSVTVKVLPYGTTVTPGSPEEDSATLAVLTSTVVK